MRVSPHLTPAGQLTPQQFYSRSFSDRLALAAKPTLPARTNTEPRHWRCSQIGRQMHSSCRNNIFGYCGWSFFAYILDLFYLGLSFKRRTCAIPQGHGHFFFFWIALLCNLCRIAGALEVGRHPGPSVIMNSFLLSLSLVVSLSVSSCLSTSLPVSVKWYSAKL